jgi:hypothetical protein
MSKIDCIFSLQNILLHQLNTIVASGTNLSAAQTFHKLAMTADNHSFDDGMWAQVRNFYDPLTRTFLSNVQEINAAIEAGRIKPSSFAAYTKLLAASLLAA